MSCSVCPDGMGIPPSFRCLICNDFKLCQSCYHKSEERLDHQMHHPMQCLLRDFEVQLYYKGERGTPRQNSFPCPFCDQLGLSGAELLDHAIRELVAGCRSFYCPLCLLENREERVAGDFAIHLTSNHSVEFARWSLLLTGVAYGTFWQSRYTKKELAMKDIKEAEKVKRDAKIAAEKAAAAAAEMAELEKMSGSKK